MREAVKKNIFIYCLAVILSICLKINAYPNQTFYHGEKIRKTSFTWHQKSTEHFVVMYRDKYFDPEQILKRLSQEFNIQPLISGIKIKLFIDDDLPYTIVGAKIIHARDEKTFIHELAHVLFLQLNRNAPMSIAEGIAVYAESEGQLSVPNVDVKEIISAEEDFNKTSRTSAARRVYGGKPKRNTEKQLYSKGFCFVNNIIHKKGIEAFKEFYKKCSDVRNIQTAWDQVYGE